MVQCHENFLDKEDLNFLRNYLMYECPHFFCEFSASHESMDDMTRFYSTDFDHKDKFIISILNKISLRLDIPIKEIVRMHSNIQHYGMGGTYHCDQNSKTILLMVSGDQSAGFEYKLSDGSTEIIEFIPNTLIVFDGQKIEHRGLAPETRTPRITLAFKIN